MPSKQNLPQLTNTAGCLDKTGAGEGPYEEIKQFMRGMEGVTLTAQIKEDIRANRNSHWNKADSPYQETTNNS